MPAPWLLLLALLHALHYKLRWRWRCAGLIERLHEIGGLLEIRTTSCLALNRGVSQHFGKVDYTKVSSLDMVMSFVWVLGGVFGFACVLASSAIASCGLFWGVWLGAGVSPVGLVSLVAVSSMALSLRPALGRLVVLGFPGRFVVLRSPVVGLVGGGFPFPVRVGRVVWCLGFNMVPVVFLVRVAGPPLLGTLP